MSRKPNLLRSHCLCRAAAWLICSAALPAHAGLSLEQALARHQQLTELDAGRPTGVAETLNTPDGLLLVGGNKLGTLPQLVASPLGTGGSGLRVAHTLSDGSGGGPVLRLGLLGREEAARHWTLEGTELALPFGPGQVYASVQRRHWGPSWNGSLILDGAAPALPAVGWRKTAPTAFEHPWLAWLGPWSADVFMGRLSGHTEPARPYLIGMRLQVQPLSSLQLGFSRTLQWGGRGRDESASMLWKGLLGKDNQDAGLQPGNQLAGMDARWHWQLDNRQQMAAYGHIVGEDEAGGLPSKNMGLVGLEWAIKTGRGSLRLFVERANVIAGDAFGTGYPGVAYRHHIYRQGYTQDGLPLGHPAGGDTRVTSAGALLDAGRFSAEVVAYTGTALPTAQRLAPGSLNGVNAALAWRPAGSQTLGLSLWSGRDGAGRDTAAQLWWQQAWR